MRPCAPGKKRPLCLVWHGKVRTVHDGDTVNVNFRGDGTSVPVKVRLTGIQAMELTRYSRKRGRRGECHSVEAAERLEDLVRRRHVRLKARHANSVTGARKRLRRQISVRQGGRWVDVAAILLREGHALWFPNRREYAWNRYYGKLAARASLKGIGVWDTDACGASSAQETAPPEIQPQLKVKWDGGGTERRGFNREWVRITNPDTANPLALGGWWFRDSHLRRYRFPAGTVVPAGGSIRLFMGKGPRSAGTYYWGKRDPVFENVGGRGMGDGGYLFDTDGDLRAWLQYPCRAGCSEPLRGKLSILAKARRDEHVIIRNISSVPVNLAEYDLESSPWFYEFGREDLLLPGKALVLWIEAPAFFIPVEPDEQPSPPSEEPPGEDPPDEEPPGEEPPPDDDDDDDVLDDLDDLLPPASAAGARAARYSRVARIESWGFSRPLLANRRDVVTLRNARGAPVVCHAWGRMQCPRN